MPLPFLLSHCYQKQRYNSLNDVASRNQLKQLFSVYLKKILKTTPIDTQIICKSTKTKSINQTIRTSVLPSLASSGSPISPNKHLLSRTDLQLSQVELQTLHSDQVSQIEQLCVHCKLKATRVNLTYLKRKN